MAGVQEGLKRSLRHRIERQAARPAGRALRATTRPAGRALRATTAPLAALPTQPQPALTKTMGLAENGPILFQLFVRHTP